MEYGLLPRYERYMQAPTENILAPVRDHLVQLHFRSVLRISWRCRSRHAKGFHFRAGRATGAANRS